MLGGNLRWTSIPSRGSRNTPGRFILQKPEISTGTDEPSGLPNYEGIYISDRFPMKAIFTFAAYKQALFDLTKQRLKYKCQCSFNKEGWLTVIHILASSLSLVAGSIFAASPKPNNSKQKITISKFLL